MLQNAFFVMTYWKNLQLLGALPPDPYQGLCPWTPLGAYCGPQTPAFFSSLVTFPQSHVWLLIMSPALFLNVASGDIVLLLHSHTNHDNCAFTVFFCRASCIFGIKFSQICKVNIVNNFVRWILSTSSTMTWRPSILSSSLTGWIVFHCWSCHQLRTECYKWWQCPPEYACNWCLSQLEKSNLVGVPVKIVLQCLIHHDSDSNHLVLQFDRMDCVRLLIVSPALYSMLQWWQCPPECLCSSCQLSAASDEEDKIYWEQLLSVHSDCFCYFLSMQFTNVRNWKHRKKRMFWLLSSWELIS